ncbi:restriction endonuclease [Catenulispora rubra]|uniref:restriction endonuclease n=1 Tax=Catenulispora rubra TaxID=280293 RepID=UPI001892413A|nr:restriction endonuclease [Catenulispora rubra]
MSTDSDPGTVIRPRDLGHRTLNRLQGEMQGARHLTTAENQARLNYLDEVEIINDAYFGAEALAKKCRVRQRAIRNQLKSAEPEPELATIRGEVEALAGQRLRTLDDIYDRMQAAGTAAWTLREKMAPFAGIYLASRYVDPSTADDPLPDISSLGSAYWEIERAGKEFMEEKSNQQRFDDLLAMGRRRAAFLTSALTVSLRTIDAFGGRRFEPFIATLLEDEGFVIERRSGGSGDRGIDVIGMSLDGRRLVAQCKHSSNPDNKVGSPDLQLLNGNGKLVHGGDIAVLVTNQGLTKEAATFAVDQGLHVVDRDSLRRWATWGDPLMQILGLPSLPERPPSVRASELA